VPCPVVVRGHAGVALFGAQHNNSLEACFAHTPGLVTVMPSTPADTRGMIRAALRADDPVVFLMHKRLTGFRGSLDDSPAVVPLGRAAVRRTGTDATLVSYGAMAHVASRAAEQLLDDGYDCEVIDLRTLWPLDFELIVESIKKTGRAVVLSDEPKGPSIASEVAATIQDFAFDYLDAPVLRVCAEHIPVPHPPHLVDALVPGVDDVIAAVRESCRRWPSTGTSP
jgi:pyruvate/2-oxoglutarate/acetoin dehydrogenase E1 component